MISEVPSSCEFRLHDSYVCNELALNTMIFLKYL